MHKRSSAILIAILVLVCSAIMLSLVPKASYADNCTNLINVGDCKDMDESNIWGVVNVFLGVLAGGLLVAGTIGIIICGYTVLTARDDVSKIEKAKKRLWEIVIGLLALVIFPAIINFVLPGDTPSEVDTDITVTPTTTSTPSTPSGGNATDDPERPASEIVKPGKTSMLTQPV